MKDLFGPLGHLLGIRVNVGNEFANEEGKPIFTNQKDADLLARTSQWTTTSCSMCTRSVSITPSSSTKCIAPFPGCSAGGVPKRLWRALDYLVPKRIRLLLTIT